MEAQWPFRVSIGGRDNFVVGGGQNREAREGRGAVRMYAEYTHKRCSGRTVVIFGTVYEAREMTRLTG